MNMIPMSPRAALLKHGRVATEVLTIPTEDGDIAVEVRGLGAGVRGRILNDVMISKDGEEERSIDLGKLYPMLVIECTFDPASGERLFAPADFEMVSGLNTLMVDPIVAVASRLSGLSDKSLKEAEKSLAVQPGTILPLQSGAGAGRDDGGGS